VRRVTLEQFRAELKAQGVERLNYAFICPRCKVVQSGADLVRAGAGDEAEVMGKYIGFSCVGRFTGKGGPRLQPDGEACNWTLGGLFQFHELEVVDGENKVHPHFEVATAEQAQVHAAVHAALEGGAA
jgi:hypothetical protein